MFVLMKGLVCHHVSTHEGNVLFVTMVVLMREESCLSPSPKDVLVGAKEKKCEDVKPEVETLHATANYPHLNSPTWIFPTV
ncbi:hypothetical protein RRG08_051208 [Elysia crispata]|uniref:Uncharacterized protein n=1 Tax=Elysia crispata TaxID=231223 RepID=A0AAE0Z6H6_9GAST|nr:hypothetical protein RRG08_051208 [Elysia crispata]